MMSFPADASSARAVHLTSFGVFVLYGYLWTTANHRLILDLQSQNIPGTCKLKENTTKTRLAIQKSKVNANLPSLPPSWGLIIKNKTLGTLSEAMASCNDVIGSPHLDKKDISQSMMIMTKDPMAQKNGISLEAPSRCQAAWNGRVGGADCDGSSGSKDTIRTTTVSTVRSSSDDISGIPRVLSRCLPRLYRTELVPLDLRFGIVREEDYLVTLGQANHKVIRQAIVKGPKARASVCFVVKRPGCVLCHEQGRALSQLLTEFPENQVAAWAVVKEINVDNDGLLTLYQKYFNFPFFRDPRLALYSALGNRRVGFVPNPFKIIQRYLEVRKRLANKGIKGNIIGKGEGMVLGGILVFDRKGNIRYAYQEEFTQEAPIDQIRNALRQVIEESLVNRESKANACELNYSPTFLEAQECAVNTIKV